MEITNIVFDKITGSIINSYFYCKRSAWLHLHKLFFPNDDVEIGKIIHKDNDEFRVDNVAIDKIDDYYIYELKKSLSNKDGSYYQILYYLYILKQKGIYREGILRDYTNKREIKVILNLQSESDLLNKLRKISIFIEEDYYPEAIKDKKCEKCSYFDFCWG